MPSPSSGSAEDTFGEFTQVTSAEDSVRGMRKLRVTPIGPGPAWDMLVAVADGHPWLLEADAAQEAAAAKAEQVKPDPRTPAAVASGTPQTMAHVAHATGCVGRDPQLPPNGKAYPQDAGYRDYCMYYYYYRTFLHASLQPLDPGLKRTQSCPPGLQYTDVKKAFSKKRAKKASRRARQAERDRSDADEDAFMEKAEEEETAKLFRAAYGFDL